MKSAFHHLKVAFIVKQRTASWVQKCSQLNSLYKERLEMVHAKLLGDSLCIPKMKHFLFYK